MQHLSFHNVIFSCEHAGYSVPDRFNKLFAAHDKILQSHRGWDPGALILAGVLSAGLNAPLFSYHLTRLLIEPNRSETHPSLFSEFSRTLSLHDRDYLVKNHYRPYRDDVYRNIRQMITDKESVLHISVHTFTPVLEGKVRNFDIGLLYDPSRSSEREFSRLWKISLIGSNPEFKVRMNRPYLGKSDGLTSWLRKQFNDQQYTGIELEVNQALYNKGVSAWQDVSQKITESLSILR